MRHASRTTFGALLSSLLSTFSVLGWLASSYEAGAQALEVAPPAPGRGSRRVNSSASGTKLEPGERNARDGSAVEARRVTTAKGAGSSGTSRASLRGLRPYSPATRYPLDRARMQRSG